MSFKLLEKILSESRKSAEFYQSIAKHHSGDTNYAMYEKILELHYGEPMKCPYCKESGCINIEVQPSESSKRHLSNSENDCTKTNKYKTRYTHTCTSQKCQNMKHASESDEYEDILSETVLGSRSKIQLKKFASLLSYDKQITSPIFRELTEVYRCTAIFRVKTLEELDAVKIQPTAVPARGSFERKELIKSIENELDTLYKAEQFYHRFNKVFKSKAKS